MAYYRYWEHVQLVTRRAKFFLRRSRIYRTRRRSRKSIDTKKRRNLCLELQPLFRQTRRPNRLCRTHESL
jgi:hypothetical protein